MVYSPSSIGYRLTSKDYNEVKLAIFFADMPSLDCPYITLKLRCKMSNYSIAEVLDGFSLLF
jgi:hypothetical protein